MASPEHSVQALWPPQTLEDRLYALHLATCPVGQAGERDQLVHDAYPVKPYPVTPHRFWQVINKIIDDREVFAVRPIECRWLRQVRDRRRARRRLVVL